MFKGVKMSSVFTSIWTDRKLLIETIGIIGIAIGRALLESAEAVDTPNNNPKKEKTAVGSIYYLYQKKCRKVISNWNAENN